ncbi:Lysosomal thiol [Chamberlinius hualienensis]
MNKMLVPLLISLLVGVMAQDPVKVAVYYESKCPDSMAFISEQLWPTYQQISQIFTVTWVPFGFAEFFANGTSWDFSCQHGPEECDGNIIHSCALKYYPSNSDNVPFISCAMSQSDPPAASQQCAVQYGLDWNTINACATSEEGTQLLHDNGVTTNSANPPVTWVPWIVINDVYSEANEVLATTNFIKLVCDSYTGPLPPQCPTA